VHWLNSTSCLIFFSLWLTTTLLYDSLNLVSLIDASAGRGCRGDGSGYKRRCWILKQPLLLKIIVIGSCVDLSRLQQVEGGTFLRQCITRRVASADRIARRQFQATGQPVSRTQASDAMTSRLPRYEAVCYAGAFNGVGPFAFRYQGNGATPFSIYWYHSKGNWLRYNFAADSF